MRIYLDESKKLWEWKIIIGGFFTYHNNNYIDKFISSKKQEFNIIENIELKSTKSHWKNFTEKLSRDLDFIDFKITTFWYLFENYFYDSEDWYFILLLNVLDNIFKNIKFNKLDKINIFHDNLNFRNNKYAEKKLENLVKQKFWLKCIFNIHNSKKYLWLQLADLVVWKYKEFYLFEDVNHLDEFISIKDLMQ